MQIRNKRVLKQLQPIINAISTGSLACEFGAVDLKKQPFKGINALVLGHRSKKFKLPNVWATPTDLFMCCVTLVEKPKYTQVGSFFKKCQLGLGIEDPVTSSNPNDIYVIRRYSYLHNALDIRGYEFVHQSKYTHHFNKFHNISNVDDLIALVAKECAHVPEQFLEITKSITFAYLASYCSVAESYPSIDLSLEEITINLEHSSKYAYQISSKLIELCIPDSKDLARQNLAILSSMLIG